MHRQLGQSKPVTLGGIIFLTLSPSIGWGVHSILKNKLHFIKILHIAADFVCNFRSFEYDQLPDPPPPDTLTVRYSSTTVQVVVSRSSRRYKTKYVCLERGTFLVCWPAQVMPSPLSQSALTGSVVKVLPNNMNSVELSRVESSVPSSSECTPFRHPWYTGGGPSRQRSLSCSATSTLPHYSINSNNKGDRKDTRPTQVSNPRVSFMWVGTQRVEIYTSWWPWCCLRYYYKNGKSTLSRQCARNRT